MTRNLKVLALAVGAVLSMSAVLAAAAQAETGVLTAPQYPAIVTGEQAAGMVTFDIGPAPAIRTVSCATSDLNGTLVGPTDPVTLKPAYANCTSMPGFLPATITTNGCDYTVGVSRPGTTGQPAGTGKLGAAIDCPAGQTIEIHIYENAFMHAANVSLCTYDVLPQPGVPAGIYHNTPGPPKDVLATFQASFTTRNTIGPAAACGANVNEHLPVTLTGHYTFRGYEDQGGAEGAQIPLDIG
jgi:hypothetical protein